MTQANFLMQRSAVIDPSGRYRYSLTRRWGEGPSATWIMLNPSTADAAIDDPTIRRCIAFSTRWGYSGLQVVNVFAYRATDPAELTLAKDPIGPDHAWHFKAAIDTGSLSILAWGSCSFIRLDHITPLLENSGIPFFSLGTTADGSPKHPLYLPAHTPLQEYP